MASRISRKYYLIPVIYISVIVFFVYMQFSSTREFTENYLSVNLTGSARPGSRDRENSLSSLEVSLHGINLDFTGPQALQSGGDGSGRADHAVTGYRKNPDSIDIFFTGNFRVNISQSAERNHDYLVRVVAPEGKGTGRVSVRFGVGKQGELEKSSRFPVFSCKSGENTYFVTAENSGSAIDFEKGIIMLSPDRNGSFAIDIAQSQNSHESPSTYWLATRGGIRGAGSEERQIAARFADTAYRGWRIDRFRQDDGKWLNVSGQPLYTREIIACLGSELIRRRDFQANQWIFRLAESRNSSAQYIESALINGSTGQAYRQMQSDDLRLIEEISLKIKRKDLTVFLTNNLVQFITDRGPYSLIQELYLLAESADTGQVDIRTAAGLAEAYLGFHLNGIEREKSLEKFNRILNSRILDNLVAVGSGLFLVAGDDMADTLFTVKTALLLKKGSAAAGRPFISDIGERLVFSLIPMADNLGFLPGRIYTGAGGSTRTEGKLEPEYLYPALEQARYMPRFISLSDEIAPGTWIATCSEEVTARQVSEGLVIETSLPAGETENMIIQGIPSVSGIRLYGVNWNTAADFDRYFAGWSYSSESQTLFIKLQHRQEREKIEILY